MFTGGVDEANGSPQSVGRQVYIGCRWSTLSVIITQLVGANAAQEIDCQVWMITAYIFGYLSTLSASSLIILRM
ncbi:hypothetical protein BJV74DRAFT_823019 [Russula compacta]|nr:hypothetical protein BJV74DRAFT_823019 [Russula compacta]